MSVPCFCVSTSVFLPERLDRDHLVEVAAHGFDGIELVTHAAHFDHTDAGAIALLREWLDDTRLTVSAVHTSSTAVGVPSPWSLASRDEALRGRAVANAQSAIALAAALDTTTAVVRLGVPEHAAPASENDAAAARASLDTIVPWAAERGVALAIEVQANRWSTPDALVALIEEANDWPAVGVCLDTGQARLLGDPADAIEVASGHILTTHLNDNSGRRDEERVPYDGSVDWARTLLAFLKVGYAGPWTFEIAPGPTPVAALARAALARQRFEQALGITDEQMSQ